MGLVEHTGQLKHMIKPPMMKPIVGIVLRNVIIVDQQISGMYDPCFKGCPPDSFVPITGVTFSIDTIAFERGASFVSTSKSHFLLSGHI
jgi:hypothetical protein